MQQSFLGIGSTMIGQFIYMAGAPRGHIILDLSWANGTAQAHVTSPEHVVELFKTSEIGVRRDDEAMSLPVALGYAVLLAGLSETAMIVSGDRTAWPSAWGELMDMCPVEVRRARSH